MLLMSWRTDLWKQGFPSLLSSSQSLFLLLTPSLWLHFSLENQSWEDQQADKCWFTAAGGQSTAAPLPDVSWQWLGGEPPTSPRRGASTTQPLLLLQVCRGPAATVQQQREVPVLSLPVWMPMQMCTAGVCEHLCLLCKGCWRRHSPPRWMLSPSPVLQAMQHSDAMYSICSLGFLQRAEEQAGRAAVAHVSVSSYSSS